MSNQAKHTPTPLDICVSNNSSLVHIEGGQGSGAEGEQIATLNAGKKEIRIARAERIVHCVNNFDALVEALQDIMWFLEKKLDNPSRMQDIQAVKKAQELIKLARGES